MINFRTLAIIKREVKHQIFSKRFIFTTLALPIFLFIIAGLQFMMQRLASDEEVRLQVFGENQALLELFEQSLNQTGTDSSLFSSVEYRLSTQAELDTFIDQNRLSILTGELNAVLFIPASSLLDKRVQYYSNSAGNQILLGRIRQALNSAILSQYGVERNLDPAIVDFVARDVSIENTRLSENGSVESSPQGQQAVAVFFTFTLYFSLLLIAGPALGAVNEEKVSRVIEVVLASVTANELMAGKVIGSAIAGLTQIMIWLIPILLLFSGSLPVISALTEFNIQLDAFMLGYFILNYLVGVLIFLSIFSAFGAMFDNPQDAQASLMPVMVLVIVPFILAFSVVANPDSVMAQVSSIIPFSSILVMPARMVLINVPMWHFLLAFLLNLISLYAVILISGKIYRLTILMTGKSPSWGEIGKWLILK